MEVVTQYFPWKTRFLYQNIIFYKRLELLVEGQLPPVPVPPVTKDLKNANYFHTDIRTGDVFRTLSNIYDGAI